MHFYPLLFLCLPQMSLIFYYFIICLDWRIIVKCGILITTNNFAICSSIYKNVTMLLRWSLVVFGVGEEEEEFLD